MGGTGIDWAGKKGEISTIVSGGRMLFSAITGKRLSGTERQIDGRRGEV